MNTRLLIPIAIIAVVAIGGIAFLSINKSPQNSSQKSTESVVTDLFADAFGGSGSIKCEFEEETSTGTAYIKNGMVRIDGVGTNGQQSGSVIFKDNIVYAWEEGSTQGYMLDTSQLEKPEDGASQLGFTSAEDIRSEIEKNKPNCSKESIDDSIFDPPVDVDFQSFESLFKDALEGLPEDTQLPEGFQLPESN